MVIILRLLPKVNCQITNENSVKIFVYAFTFFFTFKNGLGRRCNVISATFPDSTLESFRHDSGISHSEGNVHEEGAV